jgi:hypothetical protein
MGRLLGAGRLRELALKTRVRETRQSPRPAWESSKKSRFELDNRMSIVHYMFPRRAGVARRPGAATATPSEGNHGLGKARIGMDGDEGYRRLAGRASARLGGRAALSARGAVGDFFSLQFARKPLIIPDSGK